MPFSKSISTCFTKYATFSGRAPRSEFWWWTLFTWLVGIILGLVPLVGTIFQLAILLPTLAVTARRLHDTDRSGWWQLLPLGAMAVAGAIIAVTAPDSAAMGNAMQGAMIVAAAGVIGTIILLIVWLASKGTAGDNRFGPDPLPPEEGLEETARTAVVRARAD